MNKIQKSCKYCGRTHKEDFICSKKPIHKKKNTEAVKFRSSTAWQVKREEIKKRDRYLCQVCIRGLYNPRYQYQYENVEVHHAISVVEWGKGTLDNKNLITLCTAHHHMADNGLIPFETIKKIINKQEKNQL